MNFDPLRHLVATIAYRFHSAVDGAPENYPDFDAGHGVRSPLALLVHCIQVLRFARSTFEPNLDGRAAIELDWDEAVQVFHDELAAIDRHFETGSPTHEWSAEKLVQGPLADVLTHIGQLSLLRRFEGHPMQRQSYIRANISEGRVGPDQDDPAPPVF